MSTFRERLYPDHGQYLEVQSVLHTGRTEFQDVLVFENHTFGKVLVLDGVVQLTERDNHIYHEMVAHVPLMAHGNAKHVLIVGGGDGGTLRQVLKHPVESVTMVELDPGVVEISRRYLPDISHGAFDDPRLTLIYGDGAQFLATAGRQFDVIIIDSTDPIGPGGQLFTDAFYEDCRKALGEGGVVSIQSGCPFYRGGEVDAAVARLGERFGAAKAFLAPVPTYANGHLALMVAGPKDNFVPALETLQSTFDRIRLQTRFYSPQVHQAAFVMVPRFDDTSHDDQREVATVGAVPDWITRSVDRRKVVSRASR